MKPNSYYDVLEDRYLFGKKSLPEEKVRQWVIYELLSTFGANINNLKIEAPVRVGTKTHYADIIIYKNHTPLIVIECKRKEDNKCETAFDQAISYASAKEISAPYAVATNGIYWKCANYRNAHWYDILEIPSLNKEEIDYIKIENLMSHFHDLKYITKYFFETISAENVKDFFQHLQEFHVGNPFPQNIDHNLYHGADYLMRVVTHGPLVETEYDEKNLRAAYKNFVNHALSHNIVKSNQVGKYPDTLNTIEKLITISYIFKNYEEKTVISTIESKLCKVIHSIVLYLIKCVKKMKAINYSARDVHLIQDYIDSNLKKQLSLRLPKPNEDLHEFNIYCQH